MSRRFAEAASRVLARRRPRRGFLTKTAVVGSALAVAPKDFLLKPASAYARVCNCNGSRCNCSKLCCDGYTEFCCTIYGTNGCPPGSLYGGWWRVSASNYCGGSNRYYMDCHQPCKKGCSCGASGVCSGRCNGTRCGCALGTCNNRKAGCTHFRYGQCNQHIRCVGPIVCRVVTCTPPWRLEPNCTRSSRTDEYTRTHNRACLSDVASPPVGELEAIGSGPGLIRVWGWAIDPDTKKPIDVNIFVNGNLAATVRANQSRPDIGEAYGSFGEDHGFDHTFASFAGSKEVCAYAIDSGRGTNPLIGCKRVNVPARGATGILENVTLVDGGIAIRGWALVPGDKNPVEVDVYVDEELAKQVKANKKRRDLADTFGDGGNRHGFTTVLATDLPSDGDAQSTVCVEVTDPDSGDAIRLGCLPTKPATAAPFGSLEKVKGRPGKVKVSGWVLDPDGGEAQALVTIDGVEAMRAPASDARADLADKYPDAAQRGGFAIGAPADPGQRSVCIYAVGSDGAVGPLLGCADVTVKPVADDANGR